MEGLRKLYRAALVTAALGAAALPACKMIGYELKRHEDGGVYFEKIGKEEVLESPEAPQPSLSDRASAYRSALKEQSELYRSGQLNADQVLENIEQLESDFADVEAEIKKRLDEQSAEPQEHTYKTLDDLKREYTERSQGQETREGFLSYTEAKLAGGEIEQDVYDSAHTWADQNFALPEDPVLPSMMNGVMAPIVPEAKPGVFKRYVLDLPNGALWIVDHTVGQLDRLRDGTPTHLSEAYEKLPLGVRAAAATAAWTSALYNLENNLVERNVVGEHHALFPGNRDDGDVKVYPLSPTATPPTGLLGNAPKPPTEEEPNPSNDDFFGGGSAK